MSPGCGPVYLLVLLGAVVVSGSPVPQFMDENLKRIHESIADVLELRQPEIGRNPLFSSVIRSINTSCQRREDVQLMNTTLNVYLHIFSSILHPHSEDALLEQLSSTERKDVSSALKKLREKLKEKLDDLRGPLNHLGRDKEEERRLNELQVDDPVVQRQALAQFKEVYQAASLIGSRRHGHTHSS